MQSLTIGYFPFYRFIGVEAQGRDCQVTSWADPSMLRSGLSFWWVGFP